MSDHLDRAEIEQRLWDEVEKARFGMLGLTGENASKHLQPMACFSDKAQGAIWFFTKKTSDLVRDAGAGHDAMFCLMAKDQEFQACIGGQLAEDFDRAKIDKYWNMHIAAWFPEGKDDPQLTLLRLTVQDAQAWVARHGPLGYALELAKAKATHNRPDVGDSAHLDIR